MQSTDYLSNEKRARPPGTHSFKEPSRTRPEYAPKDAPKVDASFACSSSEQSIDGILNEPLLRTNAKDDAVEGGDDGERPGILLAARLLVSRAGPLKAPLARLINRRGLTK